jgi:hypothetical protein
MNAQLSWRTLHPQAGAWIDTNARAGNTFAASLAESLTRYGSLTVNQLRAVENNIARESVGNVSVAGAGFDKLVTAFASATASGLKRPRLHLGALTFSLAPLSGANAGALYVKDSGDYLGKITSGGEFRPAFACTPGHRTMIETAARDPLAAAVSHGRTTGQCAVCNRPLSDPESVARGIGPVCAGKFGF